MEVIVIIGLVLAILGWAVAIWDKRSAKKQR
jgi:uncharacterized membrane protein YsdA (DUF1294 family)